MERSWWWKAALYFGVVVMACLYLVPSLVPEERQPKIVQKYFKKKIMPGLDLQGGLHLVYEVNVDKAVADKVDRMASEIEERLEKDKKTTGITVNREERDDIVILFKNPADHVK